MFETHHSNKVSNEIDRNRVWAEEKGRKGIEEERRDRHCQSQLHNYQSIGERSEKSWTEIMNYKTGSDEDGEYLRTFAKRNRNMNERSINVCEAITSESPMAAAMNHFSALTPN